MFKIIPMGYLKLEMSHISSKLHKISRSMEKKSRYIDRERYFNELAQTSKEFYINYIKSCKSAESHSRILEIGCGEGGNLLPFAELGCYVTGLDLAPNKIENAKAFFAKRGAEGDFRCSNFLTDTPPSDDALYDIILIHDVIEHIEPEGKEAFFSKVRLYLKPDGIIFFGFPAWQMPFGGHQQICRSRFCKLPFIHLLPAPIYKTWLKAFKENPSQIEELLSIKRSKMTPETFEKLSIGAGYKIKMRTFWLISPHYKAKFSLMPRKLCRGLRSIPYLRNFFTTSCFYIIAQ